MLDNYRLRIISVLKDVLIQSQKRIFEFKKMSALQLEIDILHLFVVDLLGGDTPAAQVYSMKFEEDFRSTMIVTKLSKWIAWIVVILLNLFFIFFTMLKGLRRGKSWQNTYVVACIFQFLIEFLFYETTECVIINFFIPELVRTEVQAAMFAVKKAFQSIHQGISSISSRRILNASSYFYISSHVSACFPQSLARIIIASHSTYLPGQISLKWLPNQQKWYQWNTLCFRKIGTHRQQVRYIPLSTLFILLLQRFSTIDSFVQRMIIHLLQPIVLLFLFMLTILYQNFFYFFIIFILLLVGLFVFIGWKVWHDYQAHRLEKNQISPQNQAEDVVEIFQEEKENGSLGMMKQEEQQEEAYNLPRASNELSPCASILILDHQIKDQDDRSTEGNPSYEEDHFHELDKWLSDHWESSEGMYPSVRSSSLLQ